MVWLLGNWRLLAAGAGVLVLVGIGWRVASWREQAHRAGKLQAALEQVQRQQRKSEAIGLDLNHGNNLYRPAARENDRKVQNAISNDAAGRIDADGMSIIAERIAASKAARRGAQ